MKTLFLMITCAIFAFVAIHERRRADEIESNSILMTNSLQRAIVEHELEILKRELRLEQELRKIKSMQIQPDNNFAVLPVDARRKLTNIRNARLKVERKKLNFAALRRQMLQQEIERKYETKKNHNAPTPDLNPLNSSNLPR